MDVVQKITLEVLERLEERPRHASEEIARAFHKANRVFPHEREAIVERVYGILRTARFLDYAIDDAGPVSDNGSPRRRARWYAREVLERRLRPSEAGSAMPKVDWVRVLAAPARAAQIPDPLRRLAVTESLPDWLVQRLFEEYGEADASALVRAWNETPPLTLRANSYRTGRDALIETFHGHGLEARPTAYAHDGLILESKRDVFRSPEFQDGLFEVQDEGSQLVSELVAPPPRGTVLDVCAGSGGKTLHLGALLDGKGRIVAVGVGPVGTRQLTELERRAKRAGLRNVQTVRMDSDEPVSLNAETPYTGEVPYDADDPYADADQYADERPYAGNAREDAPALAARPASPLAASARVASSFAESATPGGLAPGASAESTTPGGNAPGASAESTTPGGNAPGASAESAKPGAFGLAHDGHSASSYVGSDEPASLSAETPYADSAAPQTSWPPPLLKLVGRVDRVLVDAPCSGLGVLRRNPEARDRVTPETVSRLAALQRDILERFACFVKPGGRLIYATCSVLREENDDVVEAFLAAHTDFQIMPAKEILGKERALEIGDGERLRLLPNRQGTDGFFAVVLRKKK